MSAPETRTFQVVRVPPEEHLDSGMRLVKKARFKGEGAFERDASFLADLLLEVKEGDEVEVTARVVSRKEPA